MFDIKYTNKAYKQLKKIFKYAPNNAELIVKGIESYALNQLGNHDIKILHGKYESFKRLRIGSYRVIFDNEDNVIFVYEIKHRKDAYND